MKGEFRGLIKNGYEFLEIIGQGGFSSIYKVKSIQYNTYFAAKTILNINLKYEKHLDVFISEVKSLKQLYHPNIIQMYDYFEIEGHLFLIFELCNNINLYDDIIKNGIMNEKKFLSVSRQICDGLEYSHNQKIAHLDIKPQNILFDIYNRPKISDFGLSQKHFLFNDNPIQGTLAFISPELLMTKNKNDINIFLCDVWSLGVTFFYMITGKLPFFFSNLNEYKKKIYLTNLIFPLKLDSKIESLIKSMLFKDPIKRITIENIKKMIIKIQIEKENNNFSFKNYYDLKNYHRFLTFSKDEKKIQRKSKLIKSFTLNPPIIIPKKKYSLNLSV